MPRNTPVSVAAAVVAVVVVVVVVVAVVQGFNIESERFVVHKGSKDTKFGFSVSQHRDSNGPWVLVGAPEAKTNQEDVVRGGYVYRCHPTHANDCTPMPFDATGNHWESGTQMDNKSMQWFGAEVTSRNGVIVACAPRYVLMRTRRHEPVGRCFYGGGGHRDAFTPFSPCMNEGARSGYNQQGWCQAGYSAAITQNGNRLYVGAVGSYYWQGQVFYQDLLNTRKHLNTSEAPKQYDMSYLGFSLATGMFTGDAEEDVAVGVPRGNHLKGLVVVFDHQLNVFYNITGEQLGSYFGYSVASVDVNGDRLDDLIVGAPWHTPPDNTGAFELGEAVVFTQTPQHNFQVAQRLHGTTSRGHFGLALTSLGDLNRDGYGDFAVGAPNAGEAGAGLVYVYLGRESGPSTQPSQVLSSQTLTQGLVRTFGWSLSGGHDLDHNDYPDLVVGAHTSDAAVVFLTRPVVVINSTIKFSSARGIIDLEVKGCSLQDRTKVPCVTLLYCLSYEGHRVPNRLNLDVSLEVDTLTAVSPRMAFLQREGWSQYNVTVELRKSVENCTSVYTYMQPEVHDKLTPLVAELRAALSEGVAGGGAFYGGALRPVLAPPSSPSAGPPKATIYIKNNCGEDNVCVPDLAISTAVEKTEYVIGSLDHLSIKTHVRNSGEDAFQAVLRSSVPPGVSYASFQVLHSQPPDVTPICSLSNEEVVCEMGNPFPSEGEVTLNLIFQPQEMENVSHLLFSFNASSASREEDGGDNEGEVALAVVMKSDVDVKGISLPDGPFSYNASRYGYVPGEDREVLHERDIGPRVEHIYDISNGGPSPLPPSTLYLLWPTRTLNNEPLLYLVETPVVAPAVCAVVPDVNYLGLQVDKTLQTSLESTEEVFGKEEEEEEEEEDNKNTIKHKKRKRSKKHHRTQTVTHTHTDTGSSFNHHHRHEHSRRRERRRRRRRRKRNIQEELERELQCGPTNCTRVICRIPPLKPKDHVLVTVRSRLWIDTIEKLGMSEVSISSRVVLTTSVDGGEGEVWVGSVSSEVGVGARQPRSSLKWLVVAGSILAGLLLLALLCALLWAMGFFKRKRPQDGAESEPLSTNGYYNTAKT